MSSFERDYQEVQAGNPVEIMKTRKTEIVRSEKKLAATKNTFRASIIAHELDQLKTEYRVLDNLI